MATKKYNITVSESIRQSFTGDEGYTRDLVSYTITATDPEDAILELADVIMDGIFAEAGEGNEDDER